MSAADNTRILLVEDHAVVRQGLRTLLEQEKESYRIIEADNGSAAKDLAQQYLPHIVIMDVGLPMINGPEATRHILRHSPESKVIFLSMHDDSATVGRALRSGAKGYVLKGSGFEELRRAITEVRQGRVFLSSGISDLVLQGYLSADPNCSDPLSEREREVLKLIAEGHSGKEIASILGLSPKTVENHRSRVADKLDIRTTAGLVRYALRTGLVH